ncbi:MAG: hypothetical protein ACFFAS_04095 [Promethearchaeota archaeon]
MKKSNKSHKRKRRLIIDEMDSSSTSLLSEELIKFQEKAIQKMDAMIAKGPQINEIIDIEKLEKERKETEAEFSVEKPKYTCLVHKGQIEGDVYLCPHCQSFYCQKCVKVLKDNGDNCWSCGLELK